MHPAGSSTEHSVIFSVLASTAESVIFGTFERTNGSSSRERQPYSNALHEHNDGASHEVGSTVLQSNKSISNAKNGPGVEESVYRTIFIIICYTLIIFVSLCGNILVLRVIFSRKKLHTTTNLLIASLAFADVLTTTFNIPFNVSRFLSLNYPFPSLFCKLVPFIQVACVYVSTLTMGVIAIHRHITLSCPHRAYNSTTGPSGGNLSSVRSGAACRLGAMTVVVWLVAAILAVPHSMFNQIVYVPWRNVTYVRCRAEYPKFEFNFPFWLSVEAFLTQYLIPLSITCTLYIKIGFVVSKQGRLASNSNNRRKKEQDDARRRRIIMLAMVVLVFALCWFPLNLYHILVDFRVVKPNFNVFLVCHWIAMSSVCYNPFIYCWLNESFRKGAIKMLSFACICCSKTLGNGDVDADTDGVEITTTGNTTLMTSVNNNYKHQSVVLDNNNGDSGNCQLKKITDQQFTAESVGVNSSLPRDGRHGEHCPKAMKAATNCQKEKRKFRKLKLSSFRTNATHHHHHHHHSHNHNHQHQHHCNCKDILSNTTVENNRCCAESANGNTYANSRKHGATVQASDVRAEMISSGGTTTLTTARATCLAGKAANTSCSLESIVSSSNNSSNGSRNSNSNSCAGQQSSISTGSSSSSPSAGAFSAGKSTAAAVCNHSSNGCSSVEENAALVNSGCIQVNVSLSVQPCDTVATTASSTLNKSTFV